MKSRLYKPVLRISLLFYVALSVCASFFCSLYVFAVCVFALFFCICLLFFLFPLVPFFFTCACLSLFVERFPKKLFLALLSTDQIMEQFLSVFSSTTPNFMFSRDPLFSLFLFLLLLLKSEIMLCVNYLWIWFVLKLNNCVIKKNVISRLVDSLI